MNTPSPRVWLVTSFSLMLLIGVSLGVLADRLWLTPPLPPEQAGPPGMGMGVPPPDRVVDDLDRELHLTDDQRARVMDVLDAHRPAVRKLQNEVRDQYNAEQASLQRDIEAVLTPDQVAAFKKLMAERPGSLGRPGGRGPGPGGRGPGGPGRGRF